jgi:ribosomal protein S27E
MKESREDIVKQWMICSGNNHFCVLKCPSCLEETKAAVHVAEQRVLSKDEIKEFGVATSDSRVVCKKCGRMIAGISQILKTYEVSNAD